MTEKDYFLPIILERSIEIRDKSNSCVIFGITNFAFGL